MCPTRYSVHYISCPLTHLCFHAATVPPIVQRTPPIASTARRTQSFDHVICTTSEPSHALSMAIRHALQRPGPVRLAALLLTLAGPASRLTVPSSSRSLYTYRIAASSSGKQTPVTKPEHGLNYICQSLALSSPTATFSSHDRLSGEDAFFLSHVARSQSHVVLGLADGVGGWRDAGVDPGVFSHGLCRYMAEGTVRPQTEDDFKPRDLLTMAFDKVMKDRQIEAGGSTATIATCEPDGRIEVAKYVKAAHVQYELPCHSN